MQKKLFMFVISFFVGIISMNMVVNDSSHLSISDLSISDRNQFNSKNIDALPSVPSTFEKESSHSFDNGANSIIQLESMPTDVPIYPKNTPIKLKGLPLFVKQFIVFGEINDIEVWYLKSMKLKGWDVSQDLSQDDDKLTLYSKQDASHSSRLVGVRVQKEENKSKLTLILYPKGTKFPDFSCTFAQK